MKIDLENEPSLFGGLPSFPSTWTPEMPDEENEEDEFSFGSATFTDGNMSSSLELPQRDSAAGPDSKKRGRRPPSTAERRASHNAVERARRESLNVRFLELANALPSMASVKRPSKSMIVNKSLEFIFGAEEREKVLREEAADLRREVDELRAQLGLPPKNKAAAKSCTAPLAANKRVSVSSVHTDDSLSAGLSCSPASTTASFLASSPRDVGTPQQQSQVSPHIYNAGSLPQVAPFPVAAPAQQVQQQQQTDLQNAVAANQLLAATTALYPGLVMPSPITNQGLPFSMDMNYLMALSVQQQQQAQQNCGLAMNLGGLTGGLPNWNAYNLTGHGLSSAGLASSSLPNFAYA